ncbi:MAG: PQQ-binding-like beta-propeller repeat protein [candidate division KSB1 bacterium]|nr:PQQ-binding-like beta-propeller repeat protein [candidate division KSB1 bacterium]
MKTIHILIAVIVTALFLTPVAETGIQAADGNTSAFTWTFKTAKGINASPTLVDSTLYIGGLDQNFYALDAGTGKVKWQYQTKIRYPIRCGSMRRLGLCRKRQSIIRIQPLRRPEMGIPSGSNRSQ